MKSKNNLTADEYINQLKLMYKSHFDLEKNKKIANKKFKLYAFSHIKNKKYFANKKLKIWEYTKYEHCLVNKYDKNKLIPSEKFIKKSIDNIINVNRNHKQSYITFVKVSETPFNEKEITNIQKFSFSKSFLLGFKGWCDIRLIAVDLSNNKVYTNQEGKKVVDNYQPKRFMKFKSS